MTHGPKRTCEGGEAALGLKTLQDLPCTSPSKMVSQLHLNGVKMQLSCYESFWFTKLGLVCSPGLAASNFQQFSESIDTVN